MVLSSRSVDEERCGSYKRAIVDLPDKEVRDIGATDNAKSPFLGHAQDAIATSRGAARQEPSRTWERRRANSNITATALALSSAPGVPGTVS